MVPRERLGHKSASRCSKQIRGPYSNFEAVPTNIIIDRVGIVRYAKAGSLELEDLNRLLVPLLQEPAPAAAR